MVEGAAGGFGVMEGWHVEPGMERRGRGWGGAAVEGQSNERCCVGGELWRGGEQSEAWPGGWHGGGASLCPGTPPPLSLLVAFFFFSRTASAACFTCKTHPAERASTHGAKGARRKAFLRQRWEKREVGLLSSLSPPVSLPDEAMRQ